MKNIEFENNLDAPYPSSADLADVAFAENKTDVTYCPESSNLCCYKCNGSPRFRLPIHSMTIMKIVVFTEGTIFTHSNWLGLARAEILYLTSRRLPDEVQQVMEVLRRYSFPEGQLFLRLEGEAYKDAAERAMPDILIEDDCESIGGEVEITYPHI